MKGSQPPESPDSEQTEGSMPGGVGNGQLAVVVAVPSGTDSHSRWRLTCSADTDAPH